MQNMRILLALCVSLSLSTAIFGESIFPKFQKVDQRAPRLHTISPSQIRTGVITDLVVQGENFLQRNRWQLDGIRVVKETYVDERTLLLTVFASGRSGLREAKIENSNELTLEVQENVILFSDDFEDGELSNWNSWKGVWSAGAGEVEVTAERVGRLFPVIEQTDNVSIEFDLTLQAGKRAGILFHYRDKRNFRMMVIDGEKNLLRLMDRFGGNFETKKKFPFPVAGTHHFAVTVNNNRVQVLIDGSPFLDEDLFYVYRGQMALYAKSASARFDNFVVTRDTTANAIPLADFTVSAAGSSVTLSASSTTDPDGSIVSYEWDLGNGDRRTGVIVNYVYPSDGVFPIELTVTDNSGARTKLVKTVQIESGLNDTQQIQQVVRRFFELLADVENLTAEEICADFSTDPACSARQKQIDDIEAAQPDIEWFDVEFLSDVQVTFQSSTVAYPVRIRNLLKARYFGDPALYQTDGWHIYRLQKESDGKWHQCWYTFELISQS